MSYDPGFDWEPEDSWDASDEIREQLRNLEMRLDVLDMTEPAGDDSDEAPQLRLERIKQRLDRHRIRDNISERDHLRISQLNEDVIFIQERLDRGDR
jgi:hypothetical protein